MRIEDNNEAFAMMKRALGSLEAKIREAYNKGYKDGLKDGTNQMIEELIGMMSDKWDAKSKTEPQYHADVECNYKDCDNCGHKEYCPQSKTEPRVYELEARLIYDKKSGMMIEKVELVEQI